MCWCGRSGNKTITPEQKEKDSDEMSVITENSLNDFEEKLQKDNKHLPSTDRSNQPKLEDCYFGRPQKNE